jgi:hypothetical protein
MSSGTKNFKCDICGKAFAQSRDLKKHKERKTPCAHILDAEDLAEDKKKNPYKCRFCGRTYAQTSSLSRHMKQNCKIAPRNGDTSGMDKLYEHVLKKQEETKKQLEEMMRKMEAMEAANKSIPTSPAAITKTEHKEIKIGAGVNKGMIDQSTNKTINNVTINIFGAEKTPHITPVDVLGLFRGLGPLGEDLSKASDRLILSMAMMIYSNEKHPENITCYLPSKKGKEALVHAEGGWEVMPVSLTLSPMASRSVDELFKKQPWPGIDGVDASTDMDELSKILSYIAKNEGDLVGGAAAPGSELRAIPIRNKEILEKVLRRLPRMGDA